MIIYYLINYKLGNLYYQIEKNYELAKKYYLMAIDKNNSDAVTNLGNLYYQIKKNMIGKKILSIAIDKNNSDAMNHSR